MLGYFDVIIPILGIDVRIQGTVDPDDQSLSCERWTFIGSLTKNEELKLHVHIRENLEQIEEDIHAALKEDES